MASRRMFSKTITNSARFLKMPQEAQNLYFHLCMHADDDGIVEAFTVMQMLGSSEDTIRNLAVRNFVKPLNEDMVSYITDWNEHNLIRADRKVNSIYKDLLLQILPDAPVKEPRIRADTGLLVGTQSQRRGSTAYLPSNFKARLLPFFDEKECPICKDMMYFPGRPQGSGNQASIQHNTRISRGGEHRIENISVICFKCNMRLKNSDTESLNNKEVIRVWSQMDAKWTPNGPHRLGKVRLGKDKKPIAATSAAEWSFKDSIKKMEDSERRDMNIIALYLEDRKPNFKNREQMAVAVRRHLRPAKLLINFDDNQIIDAMAKAKKTTPEFTLETILKMLIK